MYIVAPLAYRILQSSNPIPALPPVTMKTRPFSELGSTLASVKVGSCGGHVWLMELRMRSNMIPIYERRRSLVVCRTQKAGSGKCGCIGRREASLAVYSLQSK